MDGRAAVLGRVGMVRLSLASLTLFRVIKGECIAQADFGSLRDCTCTHWSFKKRKPTCERHWYALFC